MIPLVFSVLIWWLAESILALSRPRTYAWVFSALILRPRVQLLIIGTILSVIGCVLITAAWGTSPEIAFLIDLAGIPMVFTGLAQLAAAAAGANAQQAFSMFLDQPNSNLLRKYAIVMAAIAVLGLVGLLAVIS